MIVCKGTTTSKLRRSKSCTGAFACAAGAGAEPALAAERIPVGPASSERELVLAAEADLPAPSLLAEASGLAHSEVSVAAMS